MKEGARIKKGAQKPKNGGKDNGSDQAHRSSSVVGQGRQPNGTARFAGARPAVRPIVNGSRTNNSNPVHPLYLFRCDILESVYIASNSKENSVRSRPHGQNGYMDVPVYQ